MFALPGLTILGMRSLRSLRVFQQLSFAHALTPWGEPRGRLPEAERRCNGRQGRGHVEVVALLLRSGASVEATDILKVADPRAVAAMELCRGGERMPFTCLQHEGRLVQVDPFPVSA